MTDSLIRRLETGMEAAEQVREAQLTLEQRRALAEIDPYNITAKLAGAEAETLRSWMVKRNEHQQRGWLLANFLLHRNQEQISFTFPRHESSTTFKVGIETPLIVDYADNDSGAIYGWSFGLYFVDSFKPRAFFSEVDTNRSEHYWANYENSPIDIFRVAKSLKHPDVIEKHLWYTVWPDREPPLVFSTEESNDHERETRQAEQAAAWNAAWAEIENDYPALRAIRHRYGKMMQAYGFDDDGFSRRIGVVKEQRRAEEEFSRTSQGRERLKRLEDLKQLKKAEQAADIRGSSDRAGDTALFHALGLLQAANARFARVEHPAKTD